MLLGSGNDTVNVNGTTTSADGNRGPLTVVHGGGGSDHITVNGGGGADSPLAIFGDTTADGVRYSAIAARTTASSAALAFTNPGDDVIDARNASGSVAIYGGAGNDTISAAPSATRLRAAPAPTRSTPASATTSSTATRASISSTRR